MQDNDFNIIKPVASMQNIGGLKPVKRRNERKRRSPEQHYKQADEEKQSKEQPDDSENRVRWTGTDDDTITGAYNTVTMTESKEVYAEFYQPRIFQVSSEGEYTDVQRAIDDARDNDIIVIHPIDLATNPLCCS